MTADRTSGGIDHGASSSAAGAEGGDIAGNGGVFGEDGEEGECWHELKDEDGSGCLFFGLTVCMWYIVLDYIRPPPTHIGLWGQNAVCPFPV